MREVDLDCELGPLIRLFNASFRMSLDRRRFQWLYLDNPDGRATAWFVIDQRTGEIVGCTGVFPRRVHVAGTGCGKPVTAWNCGDFCVSPAYRTLGVAVRLRQAARLAIDAGCSPFLYAHPNGRMLPVHIRVGHRPLGRMIRYAKRLRPAARMVTLDALGSLALRAAGADAWIRSRHDLEIAPRAPLAAEFDRLYWSLAPRLGTSVVRDAAYLNWRFRQNPVEESDVLVARGPGGALAGYVVFAVKGVEGRIKDWLAADTRATTDLFCGVVRELRRRNVVSVSATVLEGHPDIGRLRWLGFVRRPDTSTAVTYVPERSAHRPWVAARNAWYMTVGDRDV